MFVYINECILDNLDAKLSIAFISRKIIRNNDAVRAGYSRIRRHKLYFVKMRSDCAVLLSYISGANGDVREQTLFDGVFAFGHLMTGPHP